jgi:predicted GTPase
MTVILCKLREWLSHLGIEDGCEMGDFKPSRMTIMGAAGTGKSVLINTLVTVLRVMFDDNDVVHVAAPTGTAAFNVGGENSQSNVLYYGRR